jgi:hypothetical protein
MSTQVLNPAYLPIWDRVARAFFARKIELRYPNRFLTKAEMIRRTSPIGKGLIRGTFSCDAEVRKKGSTVFHCGTCGSCWTRRLAAFTADAQGYDAAYAEEKRPPYINVDRLAGYQVELWREALSSANPWEALLLLQPELRDVPFSDRLRLSGRTRAECEIHEILLKDRTLDLMRRHIRDVLAYRAANVA